MAAQSNSVEAVNSEITSSTERRSDSIHTRNSHERRVRQSEMSDYKREGGARSPCPDAVYLLYSSVNKIAL